MSYVSSKVSIVDDSFVNSLTVTFSYWVPFGQLIVSVIYLCVSFVRILVYNEQDASTEFSSIVSTVDDSFVFSLTVVHFKLFPASTL